MELKWCTKRGLALNLILAVITSSCSTIELPKGTSKGYSSVSFVRTDSASIPDFVEGAIGVNTMIQDAITSEFRINGFTIGQDNADLIVAYLLIIQDNVSTTMIDTHFGYGRSAGKIMDEAHKRGVIEAKRPDKFKAGAIVIDLVDAKTNELVYRDYAKRDLIKNISEENVRNELTKP